MEIIKPSGNIQHITEVICKALNPEYVLLFGTLAGGTLHSEIPTYDLLIVTNDEPKYDWLQTNHNIKLHIPLKLREITYLNLYVYSEQFVNSKSSAFFHIAKSEGMLLYSREPNRLTKPRKACNYLSIYQTSLKSYLMLFETGSKLLDDSRKHFSGNNHRLSAFYLGHATELFYKALFVVYHNFEINYEDLRTLHQRLRTLSSDLIVLFESDQNKNDRTLNLLNRFRKYCLSDVDFTVNNDELVNCLNQVAQMKQIIEILCQKRIELYNSRIEK